MARPPPCRPVLPAACVNQRGGGSRQPPGAGPSRAGDRDLPPPGWRQRLGMETAPASKSETWRLLFLPRCVTWGRCQTRRGPHFTPISHLSYAGNYYTNLRADLGPGCSQPGAQGTAFKEALAPRGHPCTCRSPRVSACLNDHPDT